MFRSGYGAYLAEQNEALDFVLNDFKNYRFFLKKENDNATESDNMNRKVRENLLPCQEAFIISTMSLKGLWAYLKEEKKVPLKFLLTSRLNQDALENYFSQIRMYCKYSSFRQSDFMLIQNAQYKHYIIVY